MMKFSVSIQKQSSFKQSFEDGLVFKSCKLVMFNMLIHVFSFTVMQSI